MNDKLLRGILSNIDYSCRCLSRFINEHDDDLEDRESLFEGINTLNATIEILKHITNE